jgi:hypothetical protein
MAIRTQWQPKELRSAPDELAQMRVMLAGALGLLRAVPPDRAPLRHIPPLDRPAAHVVADAIQASTDDGVLRIVPPSGPGQAEGHHAQSGEPSCCSTPGG